ncbi:MAG: NmrA family transcriptional regulator [Kibdelosporangium sp.]
MSDDTRNKTTLVLGGTGKTGSRVAARLVELGRPVLVGSRTGEPRFEWDDESTWPACLSGAGSVYIVYYPELAFPGVAETISAFTEAAVSHGVRKLVLLSGRGVEKDAGPSEDAVRESGASWTILRCSWFSQNFDEGWLLPAVLDGDIMLPAGDTPEPFIDAGDIADVAVAALTTDDHDGRTYELAGPRLMTFGDAAGEIAEATGRDVRYSPVTFVEYADVLRQQGLPRAFVEVFRTILDGRNAHLVDGVEQALGRPARDFRDYARKAAETGVWKV